MNFSSSGIMRILLALGVLLTLFGCKKNTTPPTQASDLIGYSVVSSMPHDTKAFTEGLVIHDGKLYESTGESESWIGVVDISTGIAERKVELSSEYFGEGITILNEKVYQLTWKHKKGFVYNLNTFKLWQEFTYNTEGWGLTHDGTNLIMSDGTNKLQYLDTATLALTKTLTVKYKNETVNSLNELEYIDGFIYANVWQTNRIAKIDPATGEVKGFLDLSALVRQAGLSNGAVDVLNGIAWHPGTKSMLVTGKYWPFIYVIKLKEATPPV